MFPHNKEGNDQLAQLIREVSNKVNGTVTSTKELVAPLREHAEPMCHVGRGAEMDGSEEGYRLQLEWYAGQLLSMVDNEQWSGINSWINCTEKFTTRKEKPE